MEHSLIPLVFLVFMVFPLLALKRWITLHLQGLGLLLWGDSGMAMILYFLTLFPGIVVHELSHWLFAKLLGVKTGKIALWPTPKGKGRVRLGSVQVARVDPLRSSLIGLAPLITGCAIIFLVGDWVLGMSQPMNALFNADIAGFGASLSGYTQASDFWIWVYGIFAISNTMLPSESDRDAWGPVLVVFGLVVGLAYALGTLTRVPPPLVGVALDLIRYLAYAFTLTVIVDLVFMLVIALLETIMGAIRGARVDYR